MNIRYPAIIKPQKPSGYFVRFPDIEEAVTQGETIDECLFNAAEVLSLVLDHRIAEGQPIPKPSRIKGARMISPDAKTQAAILIRIIRGKRPVSEACQGPGNLMAFRAATRGPETLAKPAPAGKSCVRARQAPRAFARIGHAAGIVSAGRIIRRMDSAMAFINSGGTLFPTLAHLCL